MVASSVNEGRKETVDVSLVKYQTYCQAQRFSPLPHVRIPWELLETRRSGPHPRPTGCRISREWSPSILGFENLRLPPHLVGMHRRGPEWLGLLIPERKRGSSVSRSSLPWEHRMATMRGGRVGLAGSGFETASTLSSQEGKVQSPHPRHSVLPTDQLRWIP